MRHIAWTRGFLLAKSCTIFFSDMLHLLKFSTFAIVFPYRTTCKFFLFDTPHFLKFSIIVTCHKFKRGAIHIKWVTKSFLPYDISQKSFSWCNISYLLKHFTSATIFSILHHTKVYFCAIHHTSVICSTLTICHTKV
jgi:hypothetical protein